MVFDVVSVRLVVWNDVCLVVVLFVLVGLRMIGLNGYLVIFFCIRLNIGFVVVSIICVLG